MHLGSIQPHEVQIEIYADPSDSQPPFREAMTLDQAELSEVYQYAGAAHPANHYTPRAIPRRCGISIPLETAQIA